MDDIRDVISPTLFISGMADTLVPPKMTHDLYRVSYFDLRDVKYSLKYYSVLQIVFKLFIKPDKLGMSWMSMFLYIFLIM